MDTGRLGTLSGFCSLSSYRQVEPGQPLGPSCDSREVARSLAQWQGWLTAGDQLIPFPGGLTLRPDVIFHHKTLFLVITKNYL